MVLLAMLAVGHPAALGHSYSEQLAAALFHGNAGFLFMFTLYADDSGTHDGSRVVVVAGFVSSPEQWGHFDREWQDLLDSFTISFFHMADFESRHGVYANWDIARRKDFLVKATGIMRRRARAGIAASLPTDNYAALMKRLPHQEFSSPYTLCVGVCWKLIGEWANKCGHRGLVATVCEAGTKGAGEVQKQHAQFLNDEALVASQRIGPLAFDTKKRALPLQAADFFAYETYKRMNELLTGGKRERRSIQPIIDGLPVHALYLGDDSVEDIVRRLS